MSARFKWLAILSYGGMAMSTIAFCLLILGFGRVGECSARDNTWDACQFRTNLLSNLIFYPLLIAIIASAIAVIIRPLPGEKGKWVAASAVIFAPALLACLLWFFLNLGIR